MTTWKTCKINYKIHNYFIMLHDLYSSCSNIGKIIEVLTEDTLL